VKWAESILSLGNLAVGNVKTDLTATSSSPLDPISYLIVTFENPAVEGYFNPNLSGSADAP